MRDYAPPLRDMQFVLREVAPLDEVTALPGQGEMTHELVGAVLAEAGKFASVVLSPLNPVGDRHGARVHAGEVSTAPGWKEAYQRFVSGGWNALSCDPAYGGQGAPRLVSALVDEMWNGANVSFALCPMLTRGAIEALELCGSEALKRIYLAKLVSGAWTGTMLLTEPQAGSDLSAVRARATPEANGSYRITGQKTFITYGEHDLAENIVHLVLARTPGAPEGVKGISLFVVPKFVVDANGHPGARNDVSCLSLEHKLGIHASPTAVLALGEKDGAIGWLVGEENRGLEYMFVMMNAARFSVGLEGVGLAERAYQGALCYARERIQGTELGSGSKDKVAIIRHPDVRRMLLLMKAKTEAMRALACVVAAAMDRARLHLDAGERERSQACVNLLIPVVKGWSTESAIEVASLGIQVHGGVGYVEETGAAQHLRDARITTIYEGTTGIQAADLTGRKVARDNGQALSRLIDEMRAVLGSLTDSREPRLSSIARRLRAGIDAVEEAARYLVTNTTAEPRKVAVGAVPFLELLGTVCGAWQLGRAALAAHRCLETPCEDAAFYRAKILTASFYADHVLTRAPGLARTVVDGGESVLLLDDGQF